MKRFKELLAALVVVFMSVGIACAGSGQWSPGNIQSPTISTKMNGIIVSLSTSLSANTATTILNANTARVDGYILNVSTAYIEISGVSNSTTTIDAGYSLLYPAGDTYNRDRIYLSHDNRIYQGPIYGIGMEGSSGTLTTTRSGVGKIVTQEWK